MNIETKIKDSFPTKDKLIKELEQLRATVVQLRSKRKPTGKWSDKTKVLAKARKYKTKQEWRTKALKSYEAAKILGYLEEACAHMKQERKPTKVPAGYWDVKENVLNDAKMYHDKRDWRIKSGTAYQKASNNGWLNDIVF